MTRNNRNRNNQNPTRSEERDKVLTASLAIITLYSGATTIWGAMQVLPIVLAWVIGGTIQGMLFLLLGEFTVQHAPKRKWVAVTVLTFISVYTSFFTYYKQLAGETNEKLAHEKAVRAHQNFLRDVYTPMKDHLKQLKDEATKTRELVKAEKDRGITSGLEGYGDKARELDVKALELETEAKNFKSTVDELRPKFDYELKQLQPKEILEKDGQTLAEVPKEWQKDYPGLKREMFIDGELDVSLLTPYYKVKRFEEPAIASMGIALGVDGLMIMLGTAITIKRDRKTLGQLIADGIRLLKREYAHVKEAIGEPPTLDDNKTKKNTGVLSGETIERVTLKLQGKGSKFLTEFKKAIEKREPHIINYQVLNNHPDPTFKKGFRLLVDKLKEPGRAWVQENSPNSCVVAPEHYQTLTEWLTEEIDRHSQEEEKSGLPKGFELTDPPEDDVTFTIPPN
jgi:hypothetical protein